MKMKTIELHELMVVLVKTRRETQGRIISTLVEMGENNSFNELKYCDVYDYLTVELKVSPNSAGYFKRVASTARTVPAFKEAVVSGLLSVSQGRRIATIIDNQNCDFWINASLTLTQIEMDRLLVQKRPRTRVREGIKPIGEDLREMKVALNSEEEALIERVQNLLCQKLKRTASLHEVIHEMAQCYLDKHDPVRKAQRREDAGALRPALKSEPGSHYIKAALRHRVHLRDGYRCTAKDPHGNRCQNARHLALHHIILKSQGGKNELDNLTTICGNHRASRRSSIQSGSTLNSPVLNDLRLVMARRERGLRSSDGSLRLD
jgi:hypothetical protein